MHSKRLLDLLVIGLSALSAAEATFAKPRLHVPKVKALERRQEVIDDTPAGATNSDTTPTPTPSQSPSKTPPVEPSSEPPKPSEPSTPPPDTASKTPPPTEPTPSSKPNTSTTSSPKPPADQTTPPPDESTPEPSKPVIKTIISYSTVTNSDGTESTLTSQILTTQTPGLQNGGTGGGDSGMSPQTKNTVIGVVVGIGGAIVLIALGFVAWRVWGRKKNQDEGLMDYSTPNDGKSEVGGSMSGRTPFQSTLESYHAPTNVNQAANF